jgi:drug/metabolite transporter (DMT)-like permease
MNLNNPIPKAYLCLAAICVLWSTTYTAIKVCVVSFPPFLMVGLRQLSGGLLLLGLAYLNGAFKVPNRAYILRQFVIGLILITGGNGFITWGMQYVPSGLSAVIGALTPVFVLFLNFLWGGNEERVNAQMLFGVLMGFGGLGIIFSDGWQHFLEPSYRWGIFACFGSCLTWSLGTVMAKRSNSVAVSPIMNAGIQISAGGIGGFVMSFLFDPNWDIQHSTLAWLYLAYLAVFGSAIAFGLYMYALKHLSATVSSLYTYINPIGAIFLGWIFLGEKITTWTLLGMLATVSGVWLVNSGAMKAAKIEVKS